MTAPAAVLAIDVGGTTIKAGLLAADGSVLERSVRPTGSGETAVTRILAIARDLTATAGDRGIALAAAGIVTPGIVDDRHGVVRYASNLAWHDLPLRDRLAATLGVPVALGHDVRAAGEAEGRFGAARGCGDYIHLAIGTGIAAAVVVDGRVVLGSGGGAGEIGHAPVCGAGEPCPCGKTDCLEAYASAGGLVRRYRRLTGRAATAEEIQAVRDRDAVARRIWDDGIDAIVQALTTYTMVLEPQVVVLGGGLAHSGSDLLDPVVAGLGAALVWRQPPAVRLSVLGADAALRGAALLAERLTQQAG